MGQADENHAENEYELMKKLLIETNQLITKNVEKNKFQMVKPNKVPNWIKEQNLEGYCNQLRLWDKSCQTPSATKFYEIIETLKANKEIAGLKEFVANKIMDSMDPNDPEIVEKLISAIEEKYKKHPHEKISEILTAFVNFKQEEEESHQDCQDRYQKLFEVSMREQIF